MKRNLLALSWLLLITCHLPLLAETTPQNPPQPGVSVTISNDTLEPAQDTIPVPQDLSPSVSIMIAEFASMLGSFGNIVINPSNPLVVTPSLAHMFASMVTILLEAIKSGKLPENPTRRDIINLFALDAEMRRYLRQVIVDEAVRVREAVQESNPQGD